MAPFANRASSISRLAAAAGAMFSASATALTASRLTASGPTLATTPAGSVEVEGGGAVEVGAEGLEQATRTRRAESRAMRVIALSSGGKDLSSSSGPSRRRRANRGRSDLLRDRGHG